ncbi:hypothetical protein Ddye_032146 [Dipteronia dyeriana]|uniref:ADP-ribosyl cyclase/cyclic ADP-ribose hydrolase n=1 Tax=Dipteronia dyeriana TaxID=168575 RepID=A0AAD9TKM3_9ROSI|nr:hypothetical protein Ddye_032146 [Dipteronia dyeriana]
MRSWFRKLRQWVSGPEAKLVEDIVKDICGRFHISSFDGDQRSKYVLGMDYHWEKMNELLQVESDDVRFIGICGMGGIGKTTIAEYVYDNLSYEYEVSCFLGDVRQECESSGGRKVARSKKVLIVLDDVDDQLEQLNMSARHDWFGPKSRIIVATRDEQVLKSHAIKYLYKVCGLNDDDALQLFRMNAFKNKHPMDDHVKLSVRIVNYVHGLPLVLKVLGSHLCHTAVEHWKSCTRLRKVHESVGALKIASVLNLEGCNSLQSFPSSVFSGLKSLKILNLQGCSKLDKLPENLEELEHLEELDVGGTAITQVPSSIARLTNLQKLSFQKCNSQPWWSSYLLRTNTRCLSLPSLTGLRSLKTLNLSECNLLEGTLPKDLDSLCSLEDLDLSKNKFISLPESIKRLSKLGILFFENCERLRSLPELPSNIFCVWADGCHSLEYVSLRGCTFPSIALHLVNCPKLIQNRGHLEINLAVMLLKQCIQQWGNRLSNECHICIPRNEIPEWFSCRSDDNTVKIGLPPNWLNDEFMGIAICGVFAIDHEDFDGREIGADCCMDIIGNGYIFYFPLHSFTTFESDHLWLPYMSREQFEHHRSLTWESSHLHSWEYEYDSTDYVLVSTSTCIHARFEVTGGIPLNSKAIKSTGIGLVYKRDVECFEDDLPATDASILHQHHNCSTFAGNTMRFFMPGNFECGYIRLYNHYPRSFDRLM